MGTFTARAAVTDYSFSQSSGTYVAITGGTVATTSTTSDYSAYNNIPVGFTFTFNGSNYTTLSIADDGYLNFIGSGSSSSFFTSTSYTNGIAAVNADLCGDGAGEIRYELTGTAPNRVFVVQWKNYKNYYYTGLLNFQIRLSETSNKVEIIYGSCTPSSTSYTASVGIKGTTTSDFQVRTSTTSWTATTAGTSNSSKVTIDGTIAPVSGLTFAYQLFPMNYTSSTTIQLQSQTLPGAVAAQVLKIPVVMTGSLTPKTLTNLAIGASGTNLANVTSARVYYTGTTDAFSTTTQYGTAITSLAATNNFAGSQVLANGTNYFWLVYDIDPAATINNVLDAECTQMTIGGINYVPTVTAPAGNLKISGPLSGTYTVGTGGNYANFDSFVLDLTALGIQGDITLNVISDIAVTSAITLPVPVESGAGGYYIYIKPSGGARTISGAVNSNGIFVLNGTDRVVFDGRIAGAGNNLSIINNGASSTYAIKLQSGSSAASGCTNVTIRNCNLKAGSSASGNNAIFMANATTSNGYDHDNVSILQNNISRAYYGIYAYGSSSGIYDNLLISENTIGSSVLADEILYRGVFIGNSNNAVITKNEIFGMVSDFSGNKSAITLEEGTITNPVVAYNKIRTIKNASTGGYGAYGINITSTTCTNALIANNWISDLSTLNYSSTHVTWNAFGIRLAGGTNHKLYNNTVYMIGQTPNVSSSASMSAALIITSTSVTGLDVRNNIFLNNMTHNIANSKSYAVYHTGTATQFTAINNNIYCANDPVYGNIGYFNSAAKVTLADWKTSLPIDANSVVFNVVCPSNTVLTLPGEAVSNSAHVMPMITPEAGREQYINFDMYGEARTVSNNYAGADAVTPVVTLSTNPVASMLLCENGTNSMSASGTVSYADGITRSTDNILVYKWYKDGNLVVADANTTMTGNTLTIVSAKTTHIGAYTARLEAGASFVNSTACSVAVQIPIAITAQPVDVGACFGDAPTVSLSVSATGTITQYIWEKEGSNGFATLSAPSSNVLTIPLIDAAAVTGNYRCRVVGPGNCGNAEVISSVATISVTTPLANPMYVYEFDNTKVCQDDNISVTAQIDGTVLGMKWQRQINGVWTDLNLNDYPTAGTNTLEIHYARPEQSGLYRCVVSGGLQCETKILPMADFAITIYPKFKYVKHPIDQIACENSEVILGVAGTGNVIGYRWYKDGVIITTSENSSADKAFLRLSNVNYRTSATYHADIHVVDCVGDRWVASNSAQVYVLNATQITREPVNAKAFVGHRAVFSAEAHNKGKLPPFYQDKYQWYKWDAATSTATALIDNDNIMGSASSMLTFNNVNIADFNTMPGDGYYLVVTGTCGADTTRMVTLTEGASVIITTHPIDNEVCEGSDVQFAVTAFPSNPGAPILYQWMKDGVNIQGERSSSLLITAASANDAGRYSVLVSYLSGEAEAVSSEAMLTIDMLPAITMQPDAAVTVDNGKELRLEVAADGFAPLTYQWMKDGVDITGAVDMVYTIAAVTQADAGTYTVKVMNSCDEVVSMASVVTVTKVNTSVDNPISGLNVSNISPNPSNGIAKFNISSETTLGAEITLNDASGRQVASLFNGNLTEGNNSIEINSDKLNIASGTYFVVIRTNSGIMTRYFVVVK